MRYHRRCCPAQQPPGSLRLHANALALVLAPVPWLLQKQHHARARLPQHHGGRLPALLPRPCDSRSGLSALPTHPAALPRLPSKARLPQGRQSAYAAAAAGGG